MKKLNRLQVNNIISQFLDENPFIELEEIDIIDTIDLFDRVMIEKVNQSKNEDEQEGLITSILIGKSIGESNDLIFRKFSDNKHLNYFDVFLKEGESKTIQDILKQYNISTDVLKGIKKNVPFDTTIETEVGTVRVVQELSVFDNTSPEITFFGIYLNNKIIYKYDPEKIIGDELVSGEMSFYEDFKLDFKNAKPKKAQLTKSGKPRKGEYLGRFIDSSGNITTVERFKNGQIVYRGALGRFVHK